MDTVNNAVSIANTELDGTERVTESDSMSLQLPMVVLINVGSFRESELFAQVLKDYRWATLIGEPTTGNTRTQETIVLQDGSALRYCLGGRSHPGYDRL